MRRLALLVVLLAVPAGASARTPASFFGMNLNGPAVDGRVDPVRQVAAMHAHHVASVRLAIEWNLAQPSADAPPTFDAYDTIVLAAARMGMSVLPTVFHTPPWAAENPTQVQSPPRDDSDYGRFLIALVARYGPNGTLWSDHPDVPKRPIRDWGVWNEPDLKPFFNPSSPWPARYVRLLHAAHDALKLADPGCRVVLAGLPQASWTELQKVYKAGGRPYFDVADVHPYTQKPANVIKIIRLSRQVMARNGDAAKPLYVSEFTWSSAFHLKGVHTYGWEQTEHGQALRIRDILPKLAAVRARYRVLGVYWYTWISPPGGPDSFDYSGLLRLDAKGRVVVKPALAAWTQTVAKLVR
jgi:hypothetical protein